ncbi:MAG: hypothetical protein ACREVY_18185 [Gammaproteobacteria bacterium]
MRIGTKTICHFKVTGNGDVLLVCDLVFSRTHRDALQSLRAGKATRQAGERLWRLIEVDGPGLALGELRGGEAGAP